MTASGKHRSFSSPTPQAAPYAPTRGRPILLQTLQDAGNRLKRCWSTMTETHGPSQKLTWLTTMTPKCGWAE